MEMHIPNSLKVKHDELHAQLATATQEAGALGESARVVAKLLHSHFAKEERYAMPPLSLLPKLAWGTVTADMAAILPLTGRLKAELPSMLIEHKEIVGALSAFRVAAQRAGRPEYERFADALICHAKNEEEVLYPAAVLVGEYLALRLQRQDKVA